MQWCSNLTLISEHINNRTSNAGNQTIEIEDYGPTNANFDPNIETTNNKRSTVVDVGVAKVAGNVHNEYTKKSQKSKESYIEIDGMRQDDHSISWLWYTVGDSTGPLKATTLNASLKIPKDDHISQLTVSFKAELKFFERSLIGNIRHFLMGGAKKSLTAIFSVNLED